MQSVRWPHGPVCPKCGVINEAAAIASRPGVFRCHACKAQFTVTVGTVMEGTHLPLRHWYLAMYLMMSPAKPIRTMSLSPQMGIQYRTCWHLLHRLRAMLTSGETMPLSGIIEIGETYVGGKARNRQKHRPPTTRGRGTDKPMVFAAVERDSTARTAVVGSTSAMALAQKPRDPNRSTHRYRKNAERAKAQALASAARHPGTRSAIDAKRRSKKRNACPIWLITEQLTEIRVICRSAKVEDRHIDHIIPLAGCRVCKAHSKRNLCQDCGVVVRGGAGILSGLVTASHLRMLLTLRWMKWRE